MDTGCIIPHARFPLHASVSRFVFPLLSSPPPPFVLSLLLLTLIVVIINQFLQFLTKTKQNKYKYSLYLDRKAMIMLVEAGANINNVDKEENWTVLHQAVSDGSVRVCCCCFIGFYCIEYYWYCFVDSCHFS